MAVILSLLLYAFETVNSTTRWIENDRYTEAALYKPVRSTTALLFPYLVNVNNSCMEFISIGGLLPGLSAEDIRSGISQPRNRRLAEIFHRLKLIESYGTGIRKIFALYKGCAVQPKIDVSQYEIV